MLAQACIIMIIIHEHIKTMKISSGGQNFPCITHKKRWTFCTGYVCMYVYRGRRPSGRPSGTNPCGNDPSAQSLRPNRPLTETVWKTVGREPLRKRPFGTIHSAQPPFCNLNLGSAATRVAEATIVGRYLPGCAAHAWPKPQS